MPKRPVILYRAREFEILACRLFYIKNSTNILYNKRLFKFQQWGVGQSKGMLFPISSSIFTIALLLWFFAVTTSAQTAIGGSTPDPSAMLDVQGTSKGVVFPRMTTSNRSSIVSLVIGLLIFNPTTECLEINLGTPCSPSMQSIKCEVRCGG